jgi:hypothetical protein
VTYRTKLLVVANQTVDSDELLDDLRDRASRGPITVTLIVPQDTFAGMGDRARHALQRLHDAGIDATLQLGDVDPACAVIEEWDPRRYDEVLVATLPGSTSRWLAMGLPARIRRAIDAPVHHVECHAAHPVA